jgi:hypothetical protein
MDAKVLVLLSGLFIYVCNGYCTADPYYPEDAEVSAANPVLPGVVSARY